MLWERPSIKAMKAERVIITRRFHSQSKYKRGTSTHLQDAIKNRNERIGGELLALVHIEQEIESLNAMLRAWEQSRILEQNGL